MKIYSFLILFAVSFSTALADVIMTVDRQVYYDVEFAKMSPHYPAFWVIH